ncbi:hypothetical protein [Planomicrobium okeanokoites]|uniref:Uncharacterized protein n=1 Tax=Planomicrobium okeanokoites TaxID=244 RepID=A0ABV7KT28_PLAOK|nr:hypothetical protein [Planomicrobium okeanokoites]
MDFIVGLAILIVIGISSSNIERRLKSIDETNKRVIEVLEEIKDKK